VKIDVPPMPVIVRVVQGFVICFFFLEPRVSCDSGGELICKCRFGMSPRQLEDITLEFV